MALTIGTAPAFRQRPAHRVFGLLSCIRLGEVLVLQGSPLLGALFAIGHLSLAGCAAIALLAAGSTFLIAHVFVLNDWSGMSFDVRDPNRRNDVFTTRDIGRNGVGYLSLALLVAALLLLGTFGFSTLTIAVAIAGLSAGYSFPRVHLKGVPVLSSMLHFAGGLLHFLLGYSVFTAPNWRGIQIGSFFALVFVAGHLTHEARDSDSDRVNDIRTNAVTFGKMRSFIGGLILFAISDIVLVVLALRNIVPRPLAVLVLFHPLHVYWSLTTIQSGLTFASIQWLQARYRALYAGMGLWMVATLLLVG
jgi:4-hydroxybenzoate polyprenyltransferase